MCSNVFTPFLRFKQYYLTRCTGVHFQLVLHERVRTQHAHPTPPQVTRTPNTTASDTAMHNTASDTSMHNAASDMHTQHYRT
jgi:hypothetical protein